MRKKIRYHTSFKLFLKQLFTNKIFFLFLILFFLGNFLLFTKYTQALQLFVLNEKIITLSEANPQYIHPIVLISGKFTCDGDSVAATCDMYLYALIFLLLLVEGLVLYLFVAYKRKTSKKILLGSALAIQLFLTLPFILLLIAPYKVFTDLTPKAEQELSGIIRLLNNKDAREKNNIENDASEIQRKIAAQKELPVVIEDSPKEQAMLQVFRVKQNKKDSLYRISIVPYHMYHSTRIAQQKEKINFHVLFFPDNVLVVQFVSKDIVEKLIPIFSNKLVKSEFNEYVEKIADVPKADVPDEKEYLAIRKQEEEKTKNKLKNQIQEMIDSLNSVDEYIVNTQKYIEDIEGEYTNYNDQYKNWYAECMSSSRNSATCQEGRKTIEESKNAFEQNKNQAVQYLEEAKNNRPLFVQNVALAKEYYETFLKHPSYPELEAGVFLEPDKIHLKYSSSESQQFSYYLVTGVHEYLHFYTYKTSRFSLPSFIDEGTTDYLSGKTASGFLKKETLLGYPNEVEVIKGIIKLMSEKDIIDIYFAQDETKVKKIIEEKLVKGRYDAIKTKGDLLFSVSPTNREGKGDLKREILQLLSPNDSGN